VGMKGIRVLPSFTPTSAGAESVNYTTQANTIKPIPGQQAAVTVGGGVNIDELNRALGKSGLYSVGAAHGSVSVAGGWSQTGGHGALSSYFGLGSDQILEYKIVTADGQFRVANNVTNQDLFWALRGGGGGTWGVVVEATLKVRHESNHFKIIVLAKVTYADLGVSIAKNSDVQFLPQHYRLRRPKINLEAHGLFVLTNTTIEQSRWLSRILLCPYKRYSWFISLSK
jgi:FAD/FMN-containing dehydrogenase